MLRDKLYAPWFGGNIEWGFHVIDGSYSEVVVQVENLEFQETDDGNLSVEYHIISKPDRLTDEDLKADEFKEMFQLIVNDIVKEAVEIYETKDDRSNNTQELNQQ